MPISTARTEGHCIGEVSGLGSISIHVLLEEHADCDGPVTWMSCRTTAGEIATKVPTRAMPGTQKIARLLVGAPT